MRLWVPSGRMSAFLAQGFRINAVFAQGARMKAVFARNARMSALFSHGGVVWAYFSPCPSPASWFGDASPGCWDGSAPMDRRWAWGQGGLDVVGRPHARGWVSRTWLVYTRPAIWAR